jgi:hypothetical protein
MDLKDVKCFLCPRNYTGFNHVSHTGLAVSATNTARVLRAKGINVIVRPVRDTAELETLILAESPTHVVINALWVPTQDLARLSYQYSHVHFVVLCHSNMAFLQAEPGGIRLLHQAVDLELASLGNFSVAANSRAGVRGVMDSWEAPMLYLPNLYFLDDTARPMRRHWSGGTLRIGAFGAMRPLKNPTTSAFAALAIANNLGTNLEFHINTGRNDGGQAARLERAVEAIFAGLPNAKLVKDTWQPWAGFRRQVRAMHLLLQPSFTESFNVVTADGVAEGVASVVSDVIEWAPAWWKVSPDDTEAIARCGRALISDAHTGRDGLTALTEHNISGVRAWSDFLAGKLV